VRDNRNEIRARLRIIVFPQPNRTTAVHFGIGFHRPNVYRETDNIFNEFAAAYVVTCAYGKGDRPVAPTKRPMMPRLRRMDAITVSCLGGGSADQKCAG
jgi:hypothetical protein